MFTCSFHEQIKDFRSKWQHKKTWLTSLHNYKKITTEILNNHHSELTEIELNGSLRTIAPTSIQLSGGALTWNMLVPHSGVVGKNSGRISWEWGVPAPHQAPPSPGFQCQEDKSPQLLAAKASRDWVSGRNCWSPKKFLLKTHTWTHLLRLTFSGLRCLGGSSRGTSGM